MYRELESGVSAIRDSLLTTRISMELSVIRAEIGLANTPEIRRFTSSDERELSTESVYN